MRTFTLGSLALLLSVSVAVAQTPPAGAPPAGAPTGEPAKKNANPCRDEVGAALSKLRKSSFFRMNTQMITENGPTSMTLDYVLPDRMYQKVTQTVSNTTSEVILVGEKAWANQGAGWQELPNDVMNTLRSQMYDNVVQEQKEIGEYACKGKVTHEGRDALSYKLEEEIAKDSVTRNETFRMFYVDAVTGLPLGNALLAPGREAAPMFKASYSYPLDMKIEPPKDVKPAGDADKK